MSNRKAPTQQEIRNEERIYDIVTGTEVAEWQEEIRLLKWYAEEKLAIIESRKLTDIEIDQRGLRNQVFEWYFIQDYESKKLLEIFMDGKHLVVEASGENIDNLRGELNEAESLNISPEELIQMQKAARNNSAFMSQLTNIWARIENNKLILPEGFDKTMAELTPREKNKISHRGIAIRELVAFLEENYS